MSSSQNDSNILSEKIAFISIAIRMFSGYRRATRDHIKELGGSLPTSEAITEGSIKIFPSKSLAPFATVRSNLFRKLSAKAFRTLGSTNTFAIPFEQMDTVQSIIAGAETEFAAAKADLDVQYDAIFEQHLKDNKEAESIIRSLGVDKATALSRLSFSTMVFRVEAIAQEANGKEHSLEQMVSGLTRQLYEEIAGEAVEFLKHKAFVERKMCQKTLKTLRAMQSKLSGFDFLDSSIPGAAKSIGDALAVMPMAGYILDDQTGNAFSLIRKLVEAIADPDAFYNVSCIMAKGNQTVDQILQVNLTPFKAVAPAAPAQPQHQSPQALQTVTDKPTEGVPPEVILPRLPIHKQPEKNVAQTTVPPAAPMGLNSLSF